MPAAPKELRDQVFDVRAILTGDAMRSALGASFDTNEIIATAKLLSFYMGNLDSEPAVPAPPVVLMPPETTCCGRALKLQKVGVNRHREANERDAPYFFAFSVTGPIRPGYEYKKACGTCKTEYLYQEIVKRARLQASNRAAAALMVMRPIAPLARAPCRPLHARPIAASRRRPAPLCDSCGEGCRGVGSGAERRERGRNRPPVGVRRARVQEPRTAESLEARGGLLRPGASLGVGRACACGACLLV